MAILAIHGGEWCCRGVEGLDAPQLALYRTIAWQRLACLELRGEPRLDGIPRQGVVEPQGRRAGGLFWQRKITQLRDAREILAT
jgi:hypothetical protein